MGLALRHFHLSYPEDAHIDKFTMDIDGKPAQLNCSPQTKPPRIYEDIRAKMRDPALLGICRP